MDKAFHKQLLEQNGICVPRGFVVKAHEIELLVEELLVGGTLVGDADPEAVVQEGQFPQTLGEGLEKVIGHLEDFWIGLEGNLGSVPLGRTHHGERPLGCGIDFLQVKKL